MAKIDAKQIRAIKYAISLGRKIQQEIPEIAEDYRNGKNKTQIIEKYRIQGIYGVNEKIALVAVGYAIRGSTDLFRTEPYEGLITNNSELERLCTEHCRDNLEKVKKNLNGKYLQEASRKSNLVQGKTLWSDEEKESVYYLSKNLKYRKKTGKRRVQNTLIAKEVNKRFHNNQQIRTPSTIHNFLAHYKKKGRKWIRTRRKI